MTTTTTLSPAPVAAPYRPVQGVLTAIQRAVDLLRHDQTYKLKQDEAVNLVPNDAIAVDVTNEAQVADMVRRTVERFGRLDAAHNNAGISHRPVPFHTMTIEARPSSGSSWPRGGGRSIASDTA